MLRLVMAAVRAQAWMMRRNVEDLLPLLSVPLLTLISMAIMVDSGRADLAGYALVASLLMTILQMGLLCGGDIIINERNGQMLEPLVATPASYFVLLVARIFVLSVAGFLAFVEAWLIARLVFGVSVAIPHPWIFGAAVLATTFASAGTSVIVATFCCFGRTSRTLQNSIGGPLYLLGGVLVPVTFLPDWVEPFSRVLFLYWSADLLRDSLAPTDPAQPLFRLGMIVLLGVAGLVAGTVVLGRMLDHLRREGTLGIV